MAQPFAVWRQGRGRPHGEENTRCRGFVRENPSHRRSEGRGRIDIASNQPGADLSMPGRVRVTMPRTSPGQNRKKAYQARRGVASRPSGPVHGPDPLDRTTAEASALRGSRGATVADCLAFARKAASHSLGPRGRVPRHGPRDTRTTHPSGRQQPNHWWRRFRRFSRFSSGGLFARVQGRGPKQLLTIHNPRQ